MLSILSHSSRLHDICPWVSFSDICPHDALPLGAVHDVIMKGVHWLWLAQVGSVRNENTRLIKSLRYKESQVQTPCQKQNKFVNGSEQPPLSFFLIFLRFFTYLVGDSLRHLIFIHHLSYHHSTVAMSDSGKVKKDNGSSKENYSDTQKFLSK